MSYPYTYATIADIQERYDPDYVDRICLNRQTGTSDYNRLTMSLEDATGEIDSYLTASYAVPLDFVPALLKRMCIDMAIYHTALTADRMTEELGIRYKGWVTHLDKIANRKIGLGVAVGQTATDASGNTVTSIAPTDGTGSNSASAGRTIRV